MPSTVFGHAALRLNQVRTALKNWNVPINMAINAAEGVRIADGRR